MGKPNHSQSHIISDPKSCQTSTDVLRAKIRDYSLIERANARAAVCDGIRFGLGEIKVRLHELENFTEKDVHGLSTRIKRRKHATTEDMYRLSHSFLQSNDNINAFANIPGALQVIVKELTGKNAERQVSAAECLCNLSLGEAHVCEKISNAVGSYLITYLDSSEDRLKRTCFWTLSNILATSSKATETLLRMELVRKLWSKYVAPNEDCCDEAAKCLGLLSRRNKRILQDKDLQFVLENINAKNPTGQAAEYHLEIVFNLELINPKNLLKESQILYFINYLLSLLHNYTELNSEKECQGIVFSIRVLANLLSTQPTAYDILLKQLCLVWQTNLSSLLNKLVALSEKSLLNEIFWLLKNVIASEDRTDGLTLESFLKNLCIPREAVEMIVK